MGTSVLGVVLAIACLWAVRESIVSRDLRGTGFRLGLPLPPTVIERGAPRDAARGATAQLRGASLRVCSRETSRARAREDGPVDRAFPVLAVLHHGADSTLVRNRLPLPSVAAPAIAALLCGHFAGKANPFGRGPWELDSLLPSAAALLLLAGLGAIVSRARRRATGLGGDLPELIDRADLPE